MKDSLKLQLETSALARIAEIFIVFGAAGFIITLFLDPDAVNPLYNMGVVWVANVVMLILIWAGMKIRDESCLSFGLSFKIPSGRTLFKIFGYSLLVFILAMVGFILGSVIMANISGIPEQADMSNYNYLKGNLPLLLLSLAGVYAVSSFGEEVIYRAFLITRIKEIAQGKKWSNFLAVVLSAVIFGFAHYSWGPMGIVQTFFMGLVLGICYLKLKRNLWILILAHAYMDTILLAQMYLAP